MAAKSQEDREDLPGRGKSPNDSGLTYLIVRPEGGGLKDLFRFWALEDVDSGSRFVDSSEDGVVGEVASDNRWIIFVSIIVRKIISVFGKPMEWTGYLVDFILNLLSLNGDLFGLLCNLVHGKVVVPKRGSETFISSIGHLDGRIDLHKDESFVQGMMEEGNGKLEAGNRGLMGLCIMASKLAYENALVVKNVVVDHWKMHFVDFFDCWNDFQKENSTQVFILCDNPKDANLILISFRGTEPFDADDWSTDFGYSWYEIPKVGKVHMGFLEALGLGNRAEASTFQYHIQAKTSINPAASSNIDSEQSDTKMVPEMPKMTAYYAVRSKLKSLLKEHKNSKFAVTGHSLGGALAILFPTVLVLHEEMEVMQKLLGVYTFGQPRVGDRRLGNFIKPHLNNLVPKYFRVVYCNDLVPRLPYDDKTFLYKHFGMCLYYDSSYVEQEVDEEPNRNYFGIMYLIPEYLNAVWELIRSFFMGYIYGPEYKEGWFCILLRIAGLAFPGFSAHSPNNYINSVRLGKERMVRMSSM